MKRVLFLLLAAFLTGCAVSKPEVIIARPTYLDAIRPIQLKTEGLQESQVIYLKSLDWTLVPQGFSNICTATYVDHNGDHFWLTAAHCLSDIGPEGRYVEGQSVHILKLDTNVDLAKFRVESFEAPRSVKIASEPASWYTPLTVAGHPFGYQPIFITRGWVSNPDALFEGERPYMVFNVGGAPGNSGSPVMNQYFEIVSVLQIGWGRSFSPVTGGATTDQLRNFLK